MKALFRITVRLIIFGLLTLITQVGGLVYLLQLLIWKYLIHKKVGHNKWTETLLKSSSFLLLSTSFTFLIIPPIAKQLGREPLPIFSSSTIKPLNFMTCLLNRHYVDPKLRTAIDHIAENVQEEYPGTIVAYLDGNFPFYDGFPLLPHLSHNDGEKLDLAFLYTDNTTGKQLNRTAPSFIGYGAFEAPTPHEYNQPNICNKKGHWQYSILGTIIPKWHTENYRFDSERTSSLLHHITAEPAIQKVFIEPHLKHRLNLNSSKIRFHGCQAVRHDDHIHVQL